MAPSTGRATDVVRVLVTGGAGFIGANLCRRLLGGDHEVVVIDDLSTGDRANLRDIEDDLEVRVASILDGERLDQALARVDAVVHLAARPSVPRSLDDPMATHAVNATGTLAVLEAARRAGGPYLVVASSSSVYGGNPTLPKNEDLAPRPLSPYAASKLAAEAYTFAAQHSFGMDVLVFRFFNVFGPLQSAGHDYAAVVPAFVDAALAGRPVRVQGDGAQTRDFTFVDSVTAVLDEAVTRRVTATVPVNLAFGTRTDLVTVIERLEVVLGRPLERVHVERRVGDVDHSEADPTRLWSLFPDVRPVGLDEGLRATVDWFRSGR